ncbi:MAG: DNA-directed RNA polymerase subunit omega [Ignavibacteriaceae bacterium]
MGINPVDLRSIDERAANIYEGIIVTSKKARKINDDNKIEFNALVGTIPTTTADDESEDIENPAQLKIALDFEKREKPHIQALQELLNGQIEFRYKQ